jgi:hypothetical protein
VICTFIKLTVKKENSMSIESDLNRIATSLEEIVKALRINQGNAIAPPAPTPPSKVASAAGPGGTETLGGKKGKSGTPQPAQTVVEDLITGQSMPVAQAAQTTPQPTLDEVLVQLRLLRYSQKPTGGVEACKKLMIEFGADKDRPVISSIPPANYVALIAKIGTLL